MLLLSALKSAIISFYYSSLYSSLYSISYLQVAHSCFVALFQHTHININAPSNTQQRNKMYTTNSRIYCFKVADRQFAYTHKIRATYHMYYVCSYAQTQASHHHPAITISLRLLCGARLAVRDPTTTLRNRSNVSRSRQYFPSKQPSENIV